jgi:hypothetical protein
MRRKTRIRNKMGKRKRRKRTIRQGWMGTMRRKREERTLFYLTIFS